MSIFGKNTKKKIELTEPSVTRSMEDITKDLDAVSRLIGMLHHQKVCMEAQIVNETHKLHGLLNEMDKARYNQDQKPVDKKDV